ncbi:MAG: MFS transporter [Alphaproteobacteria bacterium]|nr:MFS transporter [Alphaproteobacteria bacterium]
MFTIYLQKNLITLFSLGFCSGVPFLLTLSTLSFWLSEIGVSKSIIGLFMVTSLPYSLKFLWAPVIEKASLPILTTLLGQRKSWGLVSQIGCCCMIVALGLSNPATNLLFSGFCAFGISFFAATLDIIVDAYRIDLLDKKMAGAGAAAESIGFRFGMLTSGAGTLYLAACYGWPAAYCLTAVFCAVGIVALLSMKETAPSVSIPDHSVDFSASWKTLASGPFFIQLLAFILFFKVGDTVLSAMSSPFLFDLGFTKVDYANVTKFFGIGMMVSGSLVGGILIHKMGITRSLVLCAILQGLSCFMFVVQSWAGCNMRVLVVTIGVESFCSGLCSAAFISYLSRFCVRPFTASHFTLLYSIGSLSRVLVSVVSGVAADLLGWTTLFFIASLSAVPTLYFLTRIGKKEKKKRTRNTHD